MRLRYYEEEERAFPKSAAYLMTVGEAVSFIQGLVQLVGEPWPTFVIGARPKSWHLCDKTNRTIYLNPPNVSVLEAIHETAHLWHCAHNTDHATAVCLLHTILRSQP